MPKKKMHDQKEICPKCEEDTEDEQWKLWRMWWALAFFNIILLAVLQLFGIPVD